ncbi:MAG: APC amino acid permease [Linnemannia gamsii]|nr:MAG: APC amino acid permease [Linnemannia gamsii]
MIKKSDIDDAGSTGGSSSGSLYDQDRIILERLGYKQSLDRSLSAFSNFGVTFSCCSIMAGLTPLYGDALQSGGPMTVIWGWLLVSFFTLMVGLSLAEICSAFPTSGGLYVWTTLLCSADWAPIASWIVGYTNWLGLCVAIASTDLAMAQFLASMVSMCTSYSPNTYVIFAIYVCILLLHGVVNSMTVRLNGLFNNMSVWWHVFGTATIVIVVLVMTPQRQSAEFVFTTWVNNTGWSSNFYVFMLGLLQSQYTLSGYDSAAHMAEETQNASTGGPMGIIMAILTASVVGWVFLLGMTFSIMNFETQIVSPAVGVALSQIFLDSCGLRVAIFLILIILGAQFFCGSALTLASSRMVYAFARDGALPMSKRLHKLNKEKSPVAAVWFNIAFCFVLGLPYIWSETAYSAIVSVNTIASSISYLIPILCRIILARETFTPGPFNLGRYSTIIGLISSGWIIVTSALFLCPTEYPVTATNMNYALVPFVLVVGVCVVYYGIWGRHWFKPGGGVGAAAVAAGVAESKMDAAGGDLEGSSEDTDGEDGEKRHELKHIHSHTPPLTPQIGNSSSGEEEEQEVGFPEGEEKKHTSRGHSDGHGHAR